MSLVSSLVIPAGVSGELLGRCVLGFGGKCATDLIEERVLEPLIAECCIWSLRQEHGAGIVRVDSIPVEMKEGARPVYPDAADGWFLHL
ncbi:MAG: hypothetical protein KDD70_08720, partial [Bdellovibrionales bacterium]|nr:hypothetical protein [Bdellovibrionales bacterium]